MDPWPVCQPPRRCEEAHVDVPQPPSPPAVPSHGYDRELWEEPHKRAVHANVHHGARPSPSTGTPEGGKEHGGFEEKEAEGDVLRQVRFLPGFFNETLHTMPPGSSFALIRADSDMFVSIYETLDALYPRLSGVYMLTLCSP